MNKALFLYLFYFNLLHMQNTQQKALKSALEWYVDHGVDEALGEEAQDRTKMTQKATLYQKNLVSADSQSLAAEAAAVSPLPAPSKTTTVSMLGKADAQAEAVKLAAAANTLEALRQAIADFDGLAVKKTATNMVFSDGNPEADIMLIGEAPGADEDRQGKPFVGISGQLLDKILACVDLSRNAENVKNAVYISNILNWRPPGNRTPSPAEIAVSLPFIEKHIMLVQPKIVILCGGVSAKTLLRVDQSISKLRKTWHQYQPQTQGLDNSGTPIAAIATYHPAYLLRTPIQKRAVWIDMLSLDAKRAELGLK